MITTHVSSSPRRTPLPAWRLCLQSTNRRLTGLSRLLLALVAGALLATTDLPAGIVFNNGFENGTAEWSATGPWKPDLANVSISSIAREGTKSVRFLPSSTDNRSELTIRNGFGNYDWYTEYWVGFSIRVHTPVPGIGAICQIHSVPQDWAIASGENAFTIKTIPSNGDLGFYTATNDLKVNGENSNGFIHTQTGSAQWGTELYSVDTWALDTWHDFVLHFRLAPDSTGYIQVWMNGNQIVDETGITVYKYDSGKRVGQSLPTQNGTPKVEYNFQKIGMYYGDTKGGEIFYDAVRIWEGSGGSYNAVAPGGGGSVPNAPTSLTASAPTSSTINLSWNATNVTNETGFEVDRALNSGFSSGLVTNAYTAGVNATGLTATGLSPSTTYYFRARATNTSGDSTNSNTASAMTSGGSPVVYDANALTIAASSGDASSAVTYTGASNGNFLRYNSNAIGDYITFNVNVPTANIPYAISVKYHENDYRGIVQLLIDGVNQGSAFDNHNETVQLTTAALGSKTFTTTGNHTFRFQITNKNAGSQDFQIGLDTITLTP